MRDLRNGVGRQVALCGACGSGTAGPNVLAGLPPARRYRSIGESGRSAANTLNTTREDPTLRDYVRGVWRRKGIVIGMVVLLTALALAYSFVKTPLYSASAQLIYESQINVADPLASSGNVDSSTQALEIANVPSVIGSPDLIQSANGDLSPNDKQNGFTIATAAPVQSGQTVSSTVSITAVSANAQTAARAANAYAQAFVTSRKELAQQRVRQAIAVIQTRIDSLAGSRHQSAEYLTLQQRLQDLQILEATVTGNFRILIPATVPSKPFTPKPVRNGLMGIVAGLVLGAGLALLIEQFDTRVRTVDEAVAIFDMPLLARIRKMPARKASQNPLVLVNDSRGPTAESIRKLRSNLEFANIDGDIKSLFITSCLQHEGKTLTVCNLALALAASGNRVILVDGDLRRPQVHRYMNLPNGKGLSTVLSGKAELDDVVLTRSFGPSLTTAGVVRTPTAIGGERDNQLAVLTSGPLPPNPAEVVASKSFARLIAQLQERFDLVILDSPALLAVGDAAAMARCADGLVFLVDLTRARRPLLDEAVAQISQMPCRKLGLVVLSQPSDRRSDRYYRWYHSETDESADTVLFGTSASQGVRV